MQIRRNEIGEYRRLQGSISCQFSGFLEDDPKGDLHHCLMLIRYHCASAKSLLATVMGDGLRRSISIVEFDVR